MTKSSVMCGRYGAAPPPTPNWRPIAGEVLGTDADELQVLSKGSVDFAAALSERLIASENMCAVFTGRPKWKDPELNLLAKERGVGAAIIHGYSSRGERFLDDISGQFCCAVHDSERGILILAVDRFSMLPLYYSTDTSGLIFSNSLSSLLSFPNQDRKVSPQGIYNYLYFHMVPAPGTIYENVSKVPSGSYLKFSAEDGATTVERYWNPTFNEIPIGKEEAKKTLLDELRVAVNNAAAERPHAVIGSFLSGGLDSSTISGLLTQLTNASSPAFTIGFDEEGYDEVEYARLSADHFGTQLHEYYTSPSDITEIVQLISKAYDEPFGNSSAVPAYCCARLAKKNGVDLLLAGDGGDELFAGNSRYLRQQVFERYKVIPKLLRSFVVEPIVGCLPKKYPLFQKIKSYIAQANVALPDRLEATYNYLNRDEFKSLFKTDFLSKVDQEAPLKLQQAVFFEQDDISTVNRMQYLDWRFTLADNDIQKVTRMCELAGVEVAYPMLSENVVDFSCTVPSSTKMEGGRLRAFYKDAMKGFLTEETLTKEKHGFGLPFGLWMQRDDQLKELVKGAMVSLDRRGFFNDGMLARALELHEKSHASYYGEFIWVLLSLELWLAEQERSTDEKCGEG